MQVPDREQIRQAFNTILTTTDQNLRKAADKFLAEVESSNPCLMITLLDVFENDQHYLIRYQALILLKNMIIRNWAKNKIIESKRTACVPNEVKDAVKDKIVTYLGVITDQKFKNEINIILQNIGKHEFPNNYQLLLQYLTSGVQNFAAEIKNIGPNTATMTKQVFIDLIETLKSIIKEQAKKRLAHQKKQQNDFIAIVFPNLLFIWETNNALLLQKLQTSVQSDQEILFLINLSKTLDRIMATAILTSHHESDLENVSNLFNKLLQKVASLIQCLGDQNSSLSLLIQNNLKTLVHSLSNIQQDYLSLIKLIITGGQNWQDKRVLKAGLLGLAKVLKCYYYYCTADQFKAALPSNKNQIFEEIQVQINIWYHQYFTAEAKTFLEALIQTTGIPEGINEEEILEQEEESYLDDLKSELQCPLYNLSLSCAEQLLTRFPQITFLAIQNIMQQLEAQNYNIGNPLVVDSVFAILGLLPRIAGRLNLQKEKLKQAVNIIGVLQYLSQTGQSKQNLRRCAVLANRYILQLEQNEMIEVIKLVIYLMGSSNDRIVQYECLMSLKTMVQGVASETLMQWEVVLQQVAPTIVHLLENFQKANIVWPLLQLLQKVIEKIQYQSVDAVRVAFEQSNLMHLMTSTSELLVDALCDMLRTLIVAFQPGTEIPHIFEMALTLIETNIKHKRLQILKLYHFILQEYTPAQNLDAKLKLLFTSNFQALLEDMDLSNIPVVVFIVEEHILLNIIPYSDFQNVVAILEDRYSISNQLESHDIGIQIKNACMNLISTMILIILNNQRNEDLLMFKDFLKLENDSPLTHVLIYKTQSVSILNRFILQDCEGFINLLSSYNITTDAYLKCWVNNMNFLSSQTDIQGQRQTKLSRIRTFNARLSEFRTSERKELLRTTQLYESVNLLDFFKQHIKNAFEFHKMSEENIKQCITDRQVLDQLIGLV